MRLTGRPEPGEQYMPTYRLRYCAFCERPIPLGDILAKRARLVDVHGTKYFCARCARKREGKRDVSL